MKISRFIIMIAAFFLLVSCTGNNHKIEVDLDADKRAELENTADTLRIEIDQYDGKEGTFPYIAIIDLARVYEELGEIGKAITLYEDFVEAGAKGRALYNNLGRLYEKIEEYDKAVVMYQKIVDEFFDENYLYDITWAYIRAGERKKAEKYFNAWQLEFRKTDEQVQKAIKELRAAEKAEEASSS